MQGSGLRVLGIRTCVSRFGFRAGALSTPECLGYRAKKLGLGFRALYEL